MPHDVINSLCISCRGHRHIFSRVAVAIEPRRRARWSPLIDPGTHRICEITLSTEDARKETDDKYVLSFCPLLFPPRRPRRRSPVFLARETNVGGVTALLIFLIDFTIADRDRGDRASCARRDRRKLPARFLRAPESGSRTWDWKTTGMTFI